MAGYHAFYEGTDYGLDPTHGKSVDYTIMPSEFSLATDPRTANQLKVTSEKISAGVKAVEVQMLTTDVTKAIPQQNLEEINRLRKLTGVELTLHGPLIEPTGVSRGTWDERERVHAEQELWQTIKRGHAIDPEGNLIVTIHSSTELPATEIKEIIKGKEEVTNISVVDERSGKVGMLPAPEEEFFEGRKPKPKEWLDEVNENNWHDQLGNINIEASRARQQISSILEKGRPVSEEMKEDPLYYYSLSVKNPEEYSKEIKATEKEFPELAQKAQMLVEDLSYANAFARGAYSRFKDMFDRAYFAAEKGKDEETINKLKNFREEAAPKIKEYQKDPAKMIEFTEKVAEGVRLLTSLKAPATYRPLKEFAIDKASETFSNVALNAYKEYGDKAPILSIENPPVGMGISTGEDLKLLVEETRNKLAEKIQKERGLSADTAMREAEKLVGVTWDVGHINMLRKYGYTEKELEEETKKVAPMVNKIHLSDNFGFEHSELPMGMGNVPMTKHLAALKEAHKEKLGKIKKVIEAGDWYQHFQTTPFPETLEAFGSPIYAMRMAPSWDKFQYAQGGYFAGYGLNPDVHHQIYGAGFSTLPVELGGQMSGKSRMGGAPIE